MPLSKLMLKDHSLPFHFAMAPKQIQGIKP
jgi:hypothetical protein